MRPYMNAGIEELVALAKTGENDAAQLASLLKELEHRRTPRASKLRREVESRLAVLQKAGPGSGKSESRNASDDAVRRAQRAEARVKELEAELLAARKGTHADPRAQVLAKWGLDGQSPEFVIVAAKKAWQKHLHPDGYAGKPPAARKLAEKKFQELEHDFHRLSGM